MTSADRDILINQGLSNELTRMFEWGDCGMNASLITMLEGFKDPRLPLYVTKNQAAVTCEDGSTIEEGTKYLGVRGGCNLPSKPNQWGNFSKVICTYTTAFPVMKVAEGYFYVLKVLYVAGAWEVALKIYMRRAFVFLSRTNWLIRAVLQV